jgi:hypothetical protein
LYYSSREIRQEKEIKIIPIGKKETKLCAFAPHIENNFSYRKTFLKYPYPQLKLTNKFRI